MLIVGLTGGIGSGKTTVAEIFRTLGVKTYDSDNASKTLIQTDPELIRAIKENFSHDLYDAENKLDRGKLADMVFNDEKKLEKLNSLVHPAVLRDFEEWTVDYRNEPYVIKETALLFEAGISDQVDMIISIYRPEELRIKSLVSRDHSTREQIRARMQNQLPESYKMSRSDYVVFNDEKHSLIKQVLELHKELKTKADQS